MPEVCIMDSIIGTMPASFLDNDYISNYFEPVEIKVERCNNIISKSGEKLGEYDFFFEWFTKPTMEQINLLINNIDKTLKPLGCSYTITTKG